MIRRQGAQKVAPARSGALCYGGALLCHSPVGSAPSCWDGSHEAWERCPTAWAGSRRRVGASLTNGCIGPTAQGRTRLDAQHCEASDRDPAHGNGAQSAAAHRGARDAPQSGPPQWQSAHPLARGGRFAIGRALCASPLSAPPPSAGQMRRRPVREGAMGGGGVGWVPRTLVAARVKVLFSGSVPAASGLKSGA